jgi:Tol biopolymer transport system component
LPDGSGVLATSLDGPAANRVERVGLDGSVSTAPPSRETEPKIASPDGTLVVYVGDGGIRIANRDGSNDRLLVKVTTNRTSISGWSPDGQSIAYTLAQFSLGTPQTWIVSRDGSGAHNWTDLPEHGRLAGWSPDGRWMLVLVRGDDNGVGRHYVVADADGSNPRALDGSIDGLVWSPDSRSLVGEAGMTIDSPGGLSTFIVVVDPSGSAATIRIDSPRLLGWDWLPGR